MRLNVSNLGRIQNAELDLRPLSVFIGPNSTNKTWVAYALYGVLGSLASSWPRHSEEVLELPPALIASLEAVADEWLAKVQANGADTVQLEAARSAIAGADSEFSISLPSIELARFLGVSADAVKDSRVQLILAPDEFEFERASELVVSVRDGAVDWAEHRDSAGNRLVRNVYSHVGGARGTEQLRRTLLQNLRRSVLPRNERTLVLPAERKLLNFTSIGAARGEQFAVALSDYEEFLKMALGYAHRGNAPASEILVEQHVISSILGGRVIHEVTDAGAVMRYVPDLSADAQPIPLTGAASLVKSLAGLSVYLRGYANPGDVLIIDEPEMNAHPEAIGKLVELLAILVNSGVRVVLTTHSPYVVDHLTNLVEASSLPAGEQENFASKLWLGQSKAILDVEKLAVYLFEPQGQNVVVREAFDRRERDLDWETFSRVSNRMSQTFDDILARQSQHDASKP